MSAKAHIVDSEEPISFHEHTRCGIELINPKPVFMWDLQEMGEPMNVSGCCRKCLKALDPKFRYSYGVKGA